MRLSVTPILLGIALALAGCDDRSTAPAAAGSAQPGASAVAPASGAAPKITAVEPVFEFGKVKLGSTVQHVFKVRNSGAAPLEIARAKGS